MLDISGKNEYDNLSESFSGCDIFPKDIRKLGA